ncbi:FecR family protein [Pseudoxanthomonas mexicana]|uniref:FecR family protein n=1 Tax=Pseudoxanthomonas mexicana TaxID=128785 RepID=UPI00398A81DB
MSDVLKFRSLVELEEEAAAWVWRLDDDNVSAEVRAEFGQWLRRDPRHRRVFEELGGVWQALDELAEAKRDEKLATFVAEERRLQAWPERKRRMRPLRWFGIGMVAASLLAATGVLFWYQQGHESQTLSTAVGQHRSARLADGSTIDINTNSIVETRFTRSERSVYLHKGEALFTVTKNPNRPFVVIAGDTRVRAVGTAFNVRMRDGGDVEVIVTEGRVEILREGGRVGIEAAPAARDLVPGTNELTAGQRFQPDAASPVDTLPEAKVANALAWREGAIVFDGVPLAKAIEELNRYTDARLVIADPGIQDMRVGGRFRTGDVDGFVAALTRAFPVATRRGADNLIYVHARETAPALRQ